MGNDTPIRLAGGTGSPYTQKMITRSIPSIHQSEPTLGIALDILQMKSAWHIYCDNLSYHNINMVHHSSGKQRSHRQK